jgi:hypothetical protein
MLDKSCCRDRNREKPGEGLPEFIHDMCTLGSSHLMKISRKAGSGFDLLSEGEGMDRIEPVSQ